MSAQPRRVGSGPGASRCCLPGWTAEGRREQRGVEPTYHSGHDRSVPGATPRGRGPERRYSPWGETGRQGPGLEGDRAELTPSHPRGEQAGWTAPRGQGAPPWRFLEEQAGRTSFWGSLGFR